MSKKIKILLVLSLIVITIFAFNTNLYTVYADSEVSEEENIDEEETTNNTTTTSSSSLSTLSPTTSSSAASINSLGNYENANLQLNNILSIILIAVGIVLILLSIAILIRLKK